MSQSTSKQALVCNPWLAGFAGLFVFICDFVTKYFTQYFFLPRHLGFTEYPYGGIGVFSHFMGIEFSIVHATNKEGPHGEF